MTANQILSAILLAVSETLVSLYLSHLMYLSFFSSLFFFIILFISLLCTVVAAFTREFCVFFVAFFLIFFFKCHFCKLHRSDNHV